MALFDVFNGDADGICALHQLRLAQPAPDATLITGPKREVKLLRRVQAGVGDQVTVLDISLDTNRADLDRLLADGAHVRYFDHHFAGDEPLHHPGLESHINTAADVCTSLLVDDWLGGQHRLWAIAAAFGDNLPESAQRRAEGLGLAEEQLGALQHLGECLNYNGYGENLADLWFHPAELYEALRPFVDPFQFIAESPAFARLSAGYAADRAEAGRLTPILESAAVAAFKLPDAPWARRLSGILANELATQHPDRAHALLTPVAGNCYTVSVRAPARRPSGADALCRQFPNGGGRAGAAGINGLPEADVPLFLEKLACGFAA